MGGGQLRQSEFERKAFLMVMIAGLLSAAVAISARAAIVHQVSPPAAPAAVAASHQS
jgi:hypothetical protein